MAIRIKPKSFGPVFIQFNEDGTLHYSANAESFSTRPPEGTPVDLLLISLGACIAKSLEIAAEQRQVPLSPFSVEVIGQKAPDLPNRLGSVAIRVVGHLTGDADKAADLLRQAKSICTVSNTLNCQIDLELDRSP